MKKGHKGKGECHDGKANAKSEETKAKSEETKTKSEETKGPCREKKARLVSSPQEALVGSPGEMIFADIEICNDN